MTSYVRASSIALLALGVTGCRGSAAERDAFALEAARVRSLTPTGGRVDGVGDVVREPLRVSQEWRLALETDWGSFSAAAASAHAGRYRCTPEADRLSCARSIPGDLFSLSYTHAVEGHVNARLEARPD